MARSAVRLVVNPANKSQFYIGYTDGYIESKGGASNLSWSPPGGYWNTQPDGPLVAFAVDFTNGKGYVLDFFGGIHPIGGADAISSPLPSSSPNKLYRDFVIDIASGSGYGLKSDGSVIAFGGAPLVAAGPSLPSNLGRRLVMDWATKKYYVLDGWGGIHHKEGAADITSNPYWSGWDIARAIQIIDWSDGKGYVMDGWGGIHPIGQTGFTPAKPQGTQFTRNFDAWKDLLVLETGPSPPLKVAQLLAGTSTSNPFVTETSTPPATVSVSAPTGAQSTRRPIVGWTPTDGGGQSQHAFDVTIFSSTQYNDPSFNTTWPSAYYSDRVTRTQASGSAQTFQITQGIGDGTFKAYVRSIKVVGASDVYSDYGISPEFSITNPPPTPTGVTPDGTVVNTDTPALGATLSAPSLGARVRARWELAPSSDPDFSGPNARVVTEPLADVRTSGATTETVPTDSSLFTGNWKIHAAAVDEYETQSTSWSGIKYFSVSHPPVSSNHIPTGGASISYGVSGDVQFSWAFSDSSPVDYQTAYQVVIERVDTGASVSDTGKVTSAISNASIGISNSLIGKELRWRVRLWDRDDVAGPYSSNQLFTLLAAPTVTITDPDDGDYVNNPAPTVTWTFSAGGRDQARYRVVIAETGGDTVYDSGVLVGANTSHAPSSSVLENSTGYTITVSALDAFGITGTDSVTITTSWSAPAMVSFSLDASNYEADGYVRISWNTGVADGAFVEWRVYRRSSGTTTWTLAGSTAVSSQLDDYLAPSGTIEYAVVQVALRYGVEVESAKVPQSVVTSAAMYWLVHPTNPSMSVQLPLVREEGFSEEYEQEELRLLGRGRKLDVGTRYGYVGTLSAQLYGDGARTAREQRLALEALRRERVALYLRNPFGDVWQVAPTNIEVERIPGVGQNEYATVRLTYTEIA